jgi:hypothetical protein
MNRASMIGALFAIGCSSRTADRSATLFGGIDLAKPVDFKQLAGTRVDDRTFAMKGGLRLRIEDQKVVAISTSCPRTDTGLAVHLGDSIGTFSTKVPDARCDFDTNADGNLECRPPNDPSIYYMLGPYDYNARTTRTKLSDLPTMTVRSIGWSGQPLRTLDLPPVAKSEPDRCARVLVTARRCHRAVYLETGWSVENDLPALTLAQATEECGPSKPAPQYTEAIVAELEAAADCTQWEAIVARAEANRPVHGWMHPDEPDRCD